MDDHSPCSCISMLGDSASEFLCLLLYEKKG
jgi:hypothetical protein